jgi:dTDP-4-dehydrorhamnose reductase
MLGRAVVERFSDGGRRVCGYDRQTCDVTNNDALSTVFKKSEVVVNCAAWTDVDGAETNPEAAHAVNVVAVEQMGHLAATMGTRLIHVSTDYVFDGCGIRPWTETDYCRPANEYGRSKLLGEQALLRVNPAAVVARVQWTYSLHGDDCVTRMMHWLVSRDEIYVVDDQVGAPTPVGYVAWALAQLIDRNASGIYHVATRGYGSRYDVAIQLRRLLSVEARVFPCASSRFPTLAQRPLNTRLDCTRFEQLTGVARPHWCHQLCEEFANKQSMEVAQ